MNGGKWKIKLSVSCRTPYTDPLQPKKKKKESKKVAEPVVEVGVETVPDVYTMYRTSSLNLRYE